MIHVKTRDNILSRAMNLFRTLENNVNINMNCCIISNLFDIDRQQILRSSTRLVSLQFVASTKFLVWWRNISSASFLWCKFKVNQLQLKCHFKRKINVAQHFIPSFFQFIFVEMFEYVLRCTCLQNHIVILYDADIFNNTRKIYEATAVTIFSRISV